MKQINPRYISHEINNPNYAAFCMEKSVFLIPVDESDPFQFDALALGIGTHSIKGVGGYVGTNAAGQRYWVATVEGLKRYRLAYRALVNGWDVPTFYIVAPNGERVDLGRGTYWQGVFTTMDSQIDTAAAMLKAAENATYTSAEYERLYADDQRRVVENARAHLDKLKAQRQRLIQQFLRWRAEHGEKSA